MSEKERAELEELKLLMKDLDLHDIGIRPRPTPPQQVGAVRFPGVRTVGD